MAEKEKVKYIKNFSKGTRNELIRMMLSAGVVTTDGFRMWDISERMYQRMICTMKEEGIVNSKYVGRGSRGSYLIDVNRQFEKYGDSVKRGYYRYYKNIGHSIVESFTRNDDVTRRQRAIRSGEVMCIMHGAKIPVAWDEKSDIMKRSNGENIQRPAYYNSLELKIGCKNVKETKSIITEASSRSIGILIGEERYYTVYMAEKHLLKWTSEVERYALISMQELLRDGNVICSREKEDCIIFTKSNEILKRMTRLNEIKNENFIGQMFTVEQSLYEKIYLIPYKREARALIKKMTEQEWDKKILKSIFGAYTKPHTAVSCDRITDGVHEYVFCIPDIVRFSRFVAVAKREKTKSMFKVYCYEWQHEMIKSVLNDDEAEVEIVREG